MLYPKGLRIKIHHLVRYLEKTQKNIVFTNQIKISDSTEEKNIVFHKVDKNTKNTHQDTPPNMP